MAVKIRLRRMGTNKKPFYRMVVADSRMPRDGRFIENLGFFDPKTEPPTIKIDEEKALLWLSRGAQPSDTVAALLKKEGIIGKPSAAKKKKTEEKPAAVESAPVVEVPEAKEEPKAEEPVKKTPVRKKRTTTKVTKKETAPKAAAKKVQPTAESEAASEEEQPSEEQG